MLLWRLSGPAHAYSFDGGYGLLFDGRWNSVGHAVTYCANSPSLCVLEKLVHVEDPDLLPELLMVQYDVPDNLAIQTMKIGDMPPDWREQESWTQEEGDKWHNAARSPLLEVPSVVMPIPEAPDANFLVNHRHRDAERIKIIGAEPFTLDARLL